MTTRTELAASAARYLRSYLATGLKGALQAGLDRCHALEIRTACGREGIGHLARCLEDGDCY